MAIVGNVLTLSFTVSALVIVLLLFVGGVIVIAAPRSKRKMAITNLFLAGVTSGLIATSTSYFFLWFFFSLVLGNPLAP